MEAIPLLSYDLEFMLASDTAPADGELTNQ